jgi:hypothetical protein
MRKIIDLGKIPLVNNLFNAEQDSLSADRYSLKIIEHNNLMMKLDTIVPPEQLFSKYLYSSGVSKPYITHCRNMWRDIAKYSPKKILDIGGNDGTLLSVFKEEAGYELQLTNVDPSETFIEPNKQKGIHFFNNYWQNIALNNKVDTIISTNVFQHTESIHGFLKGIQTNLDGIWVLEFPYFLTTVNTNQFDQIYHEHIYYWLVTPLVELFKQYGLKIIDIQELDIHGGSLRIISSNRPEAIENTELISKYKFLEKKKDFGTWSDSITEKINADRKYLDSLDGNVVLFGAAAKGVVYLNTVTNGRFKYVIDDTPGKENKYLPGTSIKVTRRSNLLDLNPDYVLILAHNFKDYIAKSLKESNYKGKCLAMLPNITLI